MENTIVACVQQRMGIMASHEEFETEARRFLNQARSKSAQLVIFPELAGLMLAPPLISSFKLGFIQRADKGSRPTAGLVSRRLGRVSGAAADVLGGGFRGSLLRLLAKDSAALQDAYVETFANLAREYNMTIVAGSLYLYDGETDTIRNRAYLFDMNGDVLGYQDKLNLAPDEADWASPGTELPVIETRLGRVGLLLGRDVLYPELGRLLAVQGAELLTGIAASPGVAQARVVRQALALRAEENQIFAACSFLVGPNHLGRGSREDYFGQSALLAPISLTTSGDGVLVQTGTNRTEGLIAAELDANALHNLWEISRFRPRREMQLGNQRRLLAELYEQGLTLEQVAEQYTASAVDFEPVYPLEPIPEPQEEVGEVVELLPESEEVGEMVDLALGTEKPEPESPPLSVPEALSLTGGRDAEEELGLEE